MWWQNPAEYVKGALGIAVALAVAALALWIEWRRLRRWPWPQDRQPVLGVMMAIVGVAAGFVALIGGGYRFHGGHAPAGLDRAFWPAVAVLVGVVAWFAAVQVPKWRARASGHWTPEAVDYHLDPDARALCAHLRTLEDDLRRAVPGLRRLHGASLHVPCRLDRSALRSRLALPDGVRFEEPVYRNRQGDEELGALLRCTHCNATVSFVHDSVARYGTPVYPPGPHAGSGP